MAQSSYQQINTDPGRVSLLIQPQSWVMVSVACGTSGPVFVGSREDLSPGQGIEVTAVPRYLFLEPGDKLYVFSETTDRVSMAVHPLSWLSALLQAVTAGKTAPRLATTVAPVVPPTTKVRR